MMSEFWNKVHFWPTMILMNCIFFPMFLQGMAGMHRRMYDGGATYELLNKNVLHWNVFISESAWLLGLAQIPFILNFCLTWKYGRKVGDNPWEATTLEWQTPIAAAARQLPQAARRLSRPLRIQRARPSDEDFTPQNTPPQQPESDLATATTTNRIIGAAATNSIRFMDIPYTVTARPDTGLYNGKLGIWLFLASEVMLFGALFTAYLFMRLGADDGTWPQHVQNVPLGLTNTCLLIISSITMVYAWVALKERKSRQVPRLPRRHHLCGFAFLASRATSTTTSTMHWGFMIKAEAIDKYRPELDRRWTPSSTGPDPRASTAPTRSAATCTRRTTPRALYTFVPDKNFHPIRSAASHAGAAEQRAGDEEETITISTRPTSSARAGNLLPAYGTYYAMYFTVTGLHALHIIGGVMVMLYFLGPGSRMYRRNPEQLSNRIEVTGIFWHFVDLVWITVFPIIYLT